MITLVLGGQASGKSDHALDLLESAPGPRAVVATGLARDNSFRRRILDHKRSRDPGLPVIEASGADLPEAVSRALADHAAVLVEGLDFWVYSCIMECGDSRGPDAGAPPALPLHEAGNRRLILVSQEAGLCPVGGDGLTRRFVRTLGGLNKRLAARADEVVLVAAGLPLRLK